MPVIVSPGFKIKGSTIEPKVGGKEVTITVDDTENVAGINVTQNDVTNNPKGVSITNTGTGNALFIDQDGETGTSDSTGGGVVINNTDNTDGPGMLMYTNRGTSTGSSLASLLKLRVDNTDWNSPVIYIKNDSTQGGGADIRIDAPVPQIEFVETDQVSPAGKFEIGANGDVFYISGRNSGDSSFEKAIEFYRLADTDKTTLLSLGGIGASLQTVTAASVTLDGLDHVTLCDCTSNAITVNLPAASTATGRIYHIKKIDSTTNKVTIDGNSTETIDGATTQAIGTQYMSYTITSDGSNWFII